MKFSQFGKKAALVVIGLCASVAHGETIRASVTSSGGELSAASGGDISGNGRYIAFHSDAPELGTSAGDDQSFLYDSVSGSVTQISFSYTGGQPNQPCMGPKANYDATRVVYVCVASNMVANETYPYESSQVYLWDKANNNIMRVSTDSSGNKDNTGSSSPDLSSDGNIVVFDSVGTNLVANDTNGKRDVFLKNLVDSSVIRISRGVSGSEANGSSAAPMLSADGRIVAFRSDATNLVSDDTNGVTDVFVYDSYTGLISRVNVSSAGAEANNAGYINAISANGRYVVFTSSATNLVDGDTEGYQDVFVHDRVNGTTLRASTTAAGAGFSGANMTATISADGRYVAFDSTSTNDKEVAGSGKDVFVKDMETGAVRQWSIGLDNTSWLDAAQPRISDVGDRVVFNASTPNLVSGDTNEAVDVFMATDPDLVCTSE